MPHLTIEDVDKQIAAYEAKHPEDTAKGLDVQSICTIINKALPILKFVKGLLFFKPKWQKIIQQIIDTAGTVCAEPEGDE